MSQDSRIVEELRKLEPFKGKTISGFSITPIGDQEEIAVKFKDKSQLCIRAMCNKVDGSWLVVTHRLVKDGIKPTTRRKKNAQARTGR